MSAGQLVGRASATRIASERDPPLARTDVRSATSSHAMSDRLHPHMLARHPDRRRPVSIKLFNSSEKRGAGHCCALARTASTRATDCAEESQETLAKNVADALPREFFLNKFKRLGFI